MISRKKLKRMEYLSFKNGIRLLADSIQLYKNRSYPSSYLLSILSMEELGRAFFIMDIAYYNWPKELPEKEKNEIFLLLYNHPHKQKSFVRWTMDPTDKKFKKVWNNSDLLDIKKQRATYVGLSKEKNKINYKGRIYSPFQVKRLQAFNSITVVHSSLLEIVLGKIHSSFGFDDSNLERIITKSLYIKLKQDWRYVDKSKQKAISKLEQVVNIS